MPNLPGAYTSNLASAHYQTLLALVQAGLAQGEYAGGLLFDQTAVEALKQQAADFTSLPVPSAGQRAYADQVNYPLSLLAARYQAIAAEKADFLATLAQYLSVLSLDAVQLDRLLAAAEMVWWQSQLPQIPGAQVWSYDFNSTNGPQIWSVDLTDPSTGLLYTDLAGRPLPVSDVSFAITQHAGGLGAPLAAKTTLAPLRLHWTLDQPAVAPVQSELLIDEQATWASLDILPPEPLLTFALPSANIILPQGMSNNVIRLRGQSSVGNLPVLIKIFFTPRTKVFTFTPDATHHQFQLSPYSISTDDLMVYSYGASYFASSDFNIDPATTILTNIDIPHGTPVTAVFTEYFPCYQCSVNAIDWSPAVLFDPKQPYPNPAKQWFPLTITPDGWYPVVDELAYPLGIQFQPIGTLNSEYLIQVQSSVSETIGAAATLQIELANPGFVNSVHLNPFTAQPMRLNSIGFVGLETIATPQIVWTGNLLVDRPMSVRFSQGGADVFATQLFLSFSQENYSLEQIVVDAPDQLRRATMRNMKTVLQLETPPANEDLPSIYTGAQYSFAVNSLYAERYQMNNPGTVVFGPFTVEGLPQVLRLDTQITGRVDTYLMWQAYNSSGVAQALASPGVGLPAGASLSFPNASSVTSASRVDLYVKCVLRDAGSVLSRLVLQASS